MNLFMVNSKNRYTLSSLGIDPDLSGRCGSPAPVWSVSLILRSTIVVSPKRLLTSLWIVPLIKLYELETNRSNFNNIITRISKKENIN